MKVTDNGSFYAAQERKSTTTVADRTKIADQNRANADIADRVPTGKDQVNVRSFASKDFAPLDPANLRSILEKLTLDIFGNSEKALSAQGNLDPKSVLALLEE